MKFTPKRDEIKERPVVKWDKGRSAIRTRPHPDNLLTCKKERTEKFSVSKKQQHENCSKPGSTLSLQSNLVILSDFTVMKDSGIKAFCTFSLHLRRASEARGTCVHAYALVLKEWEQEQEGSCAYIEALRLCKPAKIKLELYWSFQGVGNAKIVRHQPRKSAYREWNQPERGKCAAGN